VSEVERKTLADLEWEQVERAVAERCRGPLADGLHLPLAASFAETERALAEAKEAFSLLARNEPLPLEGICEIGASLQHLEREGVLDGSALKDMRLTLRAAAELRRFLGQRKESVPYLHRACAIDPTLESLEDELGMSIGDDGSILDSASAELARLREEAGNLRARIIRKLEDLIQKRSAILQDSFYTIREGRYVLPVRADAHERFHGIVHGSSASGATVSQPGCAGGGHTRCTACPASSVVWNATGATVLISTSIFATAFHDAKPQPRVRCTAPLRCAARTCPVAASNVQVKSPKLPGLGEWPVSTKRSTRCPAIRIWISPGCWPGSNRAGRRRV